MNETWNLPKPIEKLYAQLTKGQEYDLKGNKSTKLWNTKLPYQPIISKPQISATIGLPTICDRIGFDHAALFSSSLSTWCKAIESGFLTTWPELTSAQAHSH